MERDFKGVWIPKEIWLCKGLTLQEKVFLVEIDSLDGIEGCYAGNKHFSEMFDVSVGRVSQVINCLKDKGYISIEYITKDKQIEKRIIHINRPPYPTETEKKAFRKLKGGIKDSKEGYLGNAKENNTYISNTNINNKEIYKESICLIIDYLNSKTNSRYTYNNKKYNELIISRLKDGFKLEDFQYVIDVKAEEWLNDPKMSAYLKPTTLFAPSHFEDYLNQKPKEDSKNKVSNMLKELYEREVNDKRGND